MSEDLNYNQELEMGPQKMSAIAKEEINASKFEYSEDIHNLCMHCMSELLNHPDTKTLFDRQAARSAQYPK